MVIVTVVDDSKCTKAKNAADPRTHICHFLFYLICVRNGLSAMCIECEMQTSFSFSAWFSFARLQLVMISSLFENVKRNLITLKVSYRMLDATHSNHCKISSSSCFHYSNLQRPEHLDAAL